MSFIDSFFGLFFENTGLFLSLLVASAILYTCLFRKYVYSIFDPMLLVVISFCFGTADVLFMHILGTVSSYYFWSYNLTQLLFLIGFLAVRPIRIKALEQKESWRESDQARITISVLYYFVSITFLVAQLTSFFYFGIGLLQESRLMLYSEAGGGGILGRIIPVTSTMTIFLLLDRFFSNCRRNIVVKGYDIFIFLMILVSLFATGSKSSLLTIVYSVFFYCFFFCRFRDFSGTVQKLRKFQARFFVVACLGALGIIFIELLGALESSRINPLLALGLRFIQSGDIFMAAYPEDALASMEWSNPLAVVFSDFLGLLRIIPYEELPKPLGLQLYRFSIETDLIKGPNPVHNVFGLFYLGYFGSLIYSFIIGVITSVVRNKLIFALPKSRLGGLMFMLISQPMLGICTDISYSLSLINNLLFVGLPLIFFSMLFGQILFVICNTPSIRCLKFEAHSHQR
jgi:oligosaccharide repeat unit polymerase